MEPATEQNLPPRIGRGPDDSITLKLVIIGTLTILLLLPSTWVTSLMEEREGRANEAMGEVYSKWSGSQTLAGPVLVIPYTLTEKIDRGAKGIEFRERTEKYYFLPTTLDIKGNVSPKVLQRGIFDAAVYTAGITLTSDFPRPNFAALGIEAEKVKWQHAYMIFPISDLRGIASNPVFNVGGVRKESEPSQDLGIVVDPVTVVTTDENQTARPTARGIVARMNWSGADDFRGDVTIDIELKGSESLYFIPNGKTTQATLTGDWPNPSFDGQFLPDNRTTTEAGFTANWKVLHFNRPFSQQWNTKNQAIGGSVLGAKLLIPVDQYQKSIRTSKYGKLIIILTFVAIFLIEITKGIRIHPFQYILIGAALIIYYTLLLSISEQLGFDLAYLIASVATIALIGLYTTSFLKEKKFALLFAALLTVFYGFIFAIILQQDFSLLLGSVGLFIIVAATMYFSRNITWYKDRRVAENSDSTGV